MEDSDVIRLLARDVVDTLGKEYEGFVESHATFIRSWWEGPPSIGDKLVEDVQQYFHDAFVDTSWPKCLRHPNHPMEYAAGQWWCERDRVALAHLGELGSRRKGL